MLNILLPQEASRKKCNALMKKIQKLASNGFWIGKNVIWMSMTSCLMLIMPVLFFYEKECQMGERQQELQKLYVATHGPQLNA